MSAGGVEVVYRPSMRGTHAYEVPAEAGYITPFRGRGVPVDVTAEVVLHVRRGSYAQLAAVACALCGETFAVLEASVANIGKPARARGWVCDRNGYGWLCPGCAVEALS